MELKTVSKWLVVLGALEVGLMGVLSFDLIGSLLGSWPILVKGVYILIGASGLWGAYAMATNKKKKRK
ncbi:DUF378 domain-containing protein [Candidatus Woesebacteria bacterium]|nr:DUF378 domain-containing protein [Candidatus Woesebacteria bacterium]